MYNEYIPFEGLVGRILTSITKNEDNDELIFTAINGERFKMYHEQDCCESVYIEDICGDLNDLLNSPITQAEENTSTDQLAGHELPEDCFQWTFYRIATAKGQVVIRWLGQSEYYSVEVSFRKVA